MKSQAIRTAFIEYFKEKGHTEVASAPLIPAGDNTLLFTNAGMVQFKDFFTGIATPAYTSAVSVQRCLRAGGKHNDLDNVGHTARHHTFFEMLGNFSFGAYSKKDAIFYAWDFLTRILKLPAEKLWITVFETDDEAADIWLKEIKVDPTRFSRCGEADNFWSMGDTGPCGPCTEIFYDHGATVPGGPPGTPEADGDRYIEIWNLVFMQYERFADGRMEPLKQLAVDTGMGLERLSAVLQGVHNNFETDLFVPLLAYIANLAKKTEIQTTSARVIADHIRATVFLIADGIIPGNEGRAYVLRRIIRRAVRYGHQLGLAPDKAFFFKLVKPFIAGMQNAYPYLLEKEKMIAEIIQQEEMQFAQVLERGEALLKSYIEKQQLEGKTQRVLPGALIFQLYDTHGLPLDLIEDLAKENAIVLDMPGFSAHMQQQKQRSQTHSQFSQSQLTNFEINTPTVYLGDAAKALKTYRAKLLGIYAYTPTTGEWQRYTLIDQTVLQNNTEEKIFLLILDQTPFYPEGGGQIGDSGYLSSDSGLVFTVEKTYKQGNIILHEGRTFHQQRITDPAAQICEGEQITAKVDPAARTLTTKNHSATHLLHEVLRRFLGDHVQQKGSLVTPQRLRFDFSHGTALTRAQLQDIEKSVNEEIQENLPVDIAYMSIDEAKAAGAMALFGEKYTERVRVLSIGRYSKELCGGTHVARTGDIGLFKIINETGVAAGIRRIEAVTGLEALGYFQAGETQYDAVLNSLKASPDNVLAKLMQLQTDLKKADKKLITLQEALLEAQLPQLLNTAVVYEHFQLLIHNLTELSVPVLRRFMDTLKAKLDKAVILLINQDVDKIFILVAVSPVLFSQVTALEISQFLTDFLGAKGGGRKDFAQLAVPKDKAALVPEIATRLKNFLQERFLPQGG